MSKHTIKAPGDFTGHGWGLDFVNGVAVTEDSNLAHKLSQKGYEVTSEAAPAFVCPVCGKEYKTEKSLKDHLKKEHPDYKPEDPPAGDDEDTGKNQE